jgi:8-amino-7-oxononanoate synthase
MNPFTDLAADLELLSVQGRRRRLDRGGGIDFTSNDYLGLAASAELRDAAQAAILRNVPVGAGGSRLLRGNHAEHQALEESAARYFQVESALYFGSGYNANLTLFATAPQRGDLVIHDEWVHASVHDGLRRARAERVAARHNDNQSIDDAIKRWRAAGHTGRVWIAVESLYSMDGDAANLVELGALAAQRDAVLVVDEAHATGALGPAGRGLAASLEGRDDVITIHTCGKALGTAGAFVCAPAVVTDFLVNRGRPFIYATAPSPLVAAVTRAALELCEHGEARRTQLRSRVEFAAHELERVCGLTASGSHIIPILIGEDQAAVDLASTLRASGFDVRAIRPPTVPVGTARLRIAISLNVTEAEIGRLLQALRRDMIRH